MNFIRVRAEQVVVPITIYTIVKVRLYFREQAELESAKVLFVVSKGIRGGSFEYLYVCGLVLVNIIAKNWGGRLVYQIPKINKTLPRVVAVGAVGL